MASLMCEFEAWAGQAAELSQDRTLSRRGRQGRRGKLALREDPNTARRLIDIIM
jgi:hypothetical protein